MSTVGQQSQGGTATAGPTPDVSGSDGGQNPRRTGKKNRDRVSRRLDIINVPKFEGRCAELKGHIYDCSDARQADIFVRTTKEIAEYVGTTYKYGGDARLAVQNLTLPTFEMPNDPPEGAGKTVTRIWEKEVDKYVKRRTHLVENMKTLYSLVWGQCTEALRAKLEALPSHAAIAETADALALLKNIKTTSFSYQSQKYGPQALHEAKRRFYKLSQDKFMTGQAYLEKFRNCVEVIEHCGGEIGTDNGLVNATLEMAKPRLTRGTATEAQMEQATAYTRDQYLACAFILGSDRNRYGKLIEDLENDFTQKVNKYPKTLVDAYSLLENWKHNPRNIMRMLGTSSDGMAFANVSENSRQARDISQITCHKCGEKGHYATKCPKNEESGTTMLMSGLTDGEFDHEEHTVSFQFHQQDRKQKIPSTWILLDNQSTVDVFCHGDLLDDIHVVKRTMAINCNAGTSKTNLMGHLPGYGAVWYNPKGIANILSLARVEKQYRVTYDSANGSQFTVYKHDGTKRFFTKSDEGLFYLDTSKHGLDETVLINTVEDKKSNYTNRDYSRAVLARKLQNMIGRPSLRGFLRIVEGNLLKNCPITRDDILAAEDIFGPNLGSLKGKTVHRKSTHVRPEHLGIPPEIMSRYHAVTLCVDIMYVNKIPFLVSLSRHIKFGTAEVIKDRKAGSITKALQNIHAVYSKRGFTLTTCHADGEFEPLRGAIARLGMELNVASNNEHVPEIERYIRTIKERTRSTYNTLPFNRIPARMVAEMVHASVFWLNTFPPADGISATLSPRALVTGNSVDYATHCKLEFGEYVQCDEEHDNTMRTRTTGAIALRPTGNLQGGYYFFSLSSGRRLNRHSWTALPMPHEVINRVHVLARRQHAQRALLFTDSDGRVFADDDDDNEDSEYDPDLDSMDDANDDDYSYDDDEDEDDDNEDNEHPVHTAGVTGDDPANDDIADNHDDDDAANDHDLDVEGENNVNNDDNKDNDDDNNDDDGDKDDDVVYDSRTHSDGNAGDDERANISEEDRDAHNNVNSDDDDNNANNNDEHANNDYDPKGVGGGAPKEDSAPTTTSRDGEGEDREEKPTDNDNRCAPTEPTVLTVAPAVPHDNSAGVAETTGAANSTGVTGVPGVRSSIAKPTGISIGDAHEILEKKYGKRTSKHNLRPRKPRSYRHLHGEVEHTALTQHSIKKGLQLYGEAGAEAVVAEMRQLHERDVLEPKSAKMLTKREKQMALRYLMFLKMKRCGRIKGRGCADGRNQRLYKNKEETSAPTVSVEAVMITSAIDAKEGRDVATADVPCAFIQTDIDEVIYMKLEGTLAKLLTKVDPEKYTKFVETENGKDVIYVKLKKALYGTLQAALLFWQDLSSNLQRWGFEINPQDWCVANKMVDGKQCTVVWHVDDLKISHCDSEVVDGILQLLQEWYGTEDAPLVVKRGKVHDYLGMTLDFSKDGKVKIVMTDYIKDMLATLPEDMAGEATTPAANHLFTVRKDPVLLSKDRADLFHHLTAKLLFLTKRARQDIQTAVAFLTTRVKCPDEDDYKKLARVMKYLRATVDLVLTLEVDNLHMVNWWVDGAFGVHPDFKSHTGGMMSLGKGVLYSTSKKQKLNTRSSTEAELVAVDDVMAQVLWTKYFLEGQGYHVEASRIFQDNQSAMLLEKNGKGSSSKRTRHINVRYFFVTDRVKSKEVRVEYCPTGDMLADFFTKPLQGSLFRKFRDIILNLPR